MSLLSSLPILGKTFEKIVEKISPDKSSSRAELEGAPPSRLRLWRSFLGWALSLCFVWEAVLRPALLTYWPGLTLPPSTLEAVTALLMGMLGLGF